MPRVIETSCGIMVSRPTLILDRGLTELNGTVGRGIHSTECHSSLKKNFFIFLTYGVKFHI